MLRSGTNDGSAFQLAKRIVMLEEIKPRFSLLSLDHLMMLPPPEWLIEGVIARDSQVVLYGPSGHGKSFVALDMAMCVASGRPWQGRAVKKLPVVYVVGEGIRGVRKRAEAWLQFHGVDYVEGIHFVREPVQLRSLLEVSEWKTRIAAANVEPGLIILDTFARCFVGGEENSSLDVGQFINVARSIQQEYQATVATVHHTGKDQSRGERGSSALRAAMDTMISVSKSGMTLTLENDKQKDDEGFPPIFLNLTPVTLNGQDETSCAIEGGAELANGTSKNSPRPSELKALRVLAAMVEAESGEWRMRIEADAGQSEVPERSFQNWRKGLISKNLIESVPGTKSRYRVTELGAAMALPPSCHGN